MNYRLSSLHNQAPQRTPLGSRPSLVQKDLRIERDEIDRVYFGQHSAVAVRWWALDLRQLGSTGQQGQALKAQAES